MKLRCVDAVNLEGRIRLGLSAKMVVSVLLVWFFYFLSNITMTFLLIVWPCVQAISTKGCANCGDAKAKD